MKTNIYKVSAGGYEHLVRAANRAQAMRHIAKRSIRVELASQDDLVELLPRTEVVVAGTDDDEKEGEE